ncbi:hypothetical protein A7M79_19210 [Acinetobacter baumannii]|nr:hypothetical protein A7M79_19210 [Acinetobacter baumannii]
MILNWYKREILTPFKALYKILYENIFVAFLGFTIFLLINVLLFPNILFPMQKNHIDFSNVQYQVKKGRLTSLILKETSPKFKAKRYRVNCAYFKVSSPVNICENTSSIQILHLNGFTTEKSLVKTSQSPVDMVIESMDIKVNNEAQHIVVSESELKHWEDRLLLPIYILRAVWLGIYLALFFIVFKKYFASKVAIERKV